MSYLLALIYLAGLLFLIKKSRIFNAPSLSRTSIMGVFLLKVLIGIMLWAVYTFYYTDRSTADIFKFFDDSELIYEVAKEKPGNYVRMITGIGDETPEIQNTYKELNYWNKKFDDQTYNDTRLIIRFNALLRLISMGNYHIHSLFMCFFSLIGFVFLYKAFFNAFKELRWLFILSIFLLPSVLFWSSGVLKEGLLFFALGIFLYCYQNILKVFRFKYLLCMLWSVALLIFLKFYVLLCLFPTLIAYAWVKKTDEQKPVMKYAVVIVVSVVLGLSTRYFSSYDLPYMIAKKQKDFITLAKGGLYLQNDTAMLFFQLDQIPEGIEFSADKQEARVLNNTPHLLWKHQRYRDSIQGTHFPDSVWLSVFSHTQRAGSLMSDTPMEASTSGLLSYTPQALLNSLFRPHLLEVRSPFMALAALENLLIILLLFLAFFYRNKWSSIKVNLFFFCLTFALFLLALTGLSTPVLGALIRYKIPALPFLCMAILLVIDPKKLQVRFPFLK